MFTGLCRADQVQTAENSVLNGIKRTLGDFAAMHCRDGRGCASTCRSAIARRKIGGEERVGGHTVATTRSSCVTFSRTNAFFFVNFCRLLGLVFCLLTRSRDLLFQKRADAFEHLRDNFVAFRRQEILLTQSFETAAENTDLAFVEHLRGTG